MEPTKEQDEVHEEFHFKTKEDIKSTLIRLPKLILEKELGIYNTEVQKGELIAVAKTIEGEIAREILKETVSVQTEVKVDKKTMSKEEKENYKPKYITELKQKYTNEMQRQAASNVKMLNHEEHKKMSAKIDKLDKWLSIAKINLSYVKRVFRVAESLTRFEFE